MGKIISCVVGSSGKMGQALLAGLKNDKDFGKIITVSRQHVAYQRGIFAVSPHGLDIVFNFTTPAATLESAQFCVENSLPLVTGTTGLSQKQMARLGKFAKSVPILWSPNMSLAVNFIGVILPLLGRLLPSDTDIEITEQHHRNKEDSPSGTALFLARGMAEGLGKKIICGRTEGNSPGRNSQEIYIHSLRGGEVAGGKNEVLFLAGQEEISISHRALSNSVYAAGALLAAKWLIKQKPGLYSMKDILPKLR